MRQCKKTLFFWICPLSGTGGSDAHLRLPLAAWVSPLVKVKLEHFKKISTQSGGLTPIASLMPGGFVRYLHSSDDGAADGIGHVAVGSGRFAVEPGGSVLDERKQKHSYRNF